MPSKTSGVSPELYDYLLSVSVREPSILRQLRSVSAERPGSQMLIPPDQGQFINLLLKIMGAKNILEIGTFTGYSTLWMALALPEDGHIIACDIDAESGTIAQEFWKKAQLDHKITLHVAPALETLDELIEKNERPSIDFAFIDADKRNYEAYYERCLKLVRTGGVVAIDNVLWSGRVTNSRSDDRRTRALRNLNARLHEEIEVEMSMLTIGDGLTLLRKK
ncbi:MAG: class I SAM-dependent methyltransferase [Cyanobacteria bacterium P01_C01_bin.89]